MNKLIELLKKYKFYIVLVFAFLFYFKSCSKSRTISKMEISEKQMVQELDSITNIVKQQRAKIDSFPEILRTEKMKCYLGLDDKISRLDRKPQMMKLHATIKDSILVLQK